MQITATQGGSTANGLLLRVFVLTGAKPSASQLGNSTSTHFTATTAWTASITNSANSSIYGAAMPNSSSESTTTGSNVTIVDSVADITNGRTYFTYHATGLSAGTTTRGLSLQNLASGPSVMLEILAATTLAEDGSAPGAASTTSTTTVTTASFTPPAGSLLVALVDSNGSTGIETMTVSGGSLTWTEKVKNNPSGGFYAGIWIADVPAALSLAISQYARGTAAGRRGRTARQSASASVPQVTRQASHGAQAASKNLVRVTAVAPVPARPARQAVRAAVNYARPGRVMVVRSTGAGIVPPPPVAAAAIPGGFQDRRPGYLKKRVLFGV